MPSEQHKARCRGYALILVPELRKRARELGYALGVHGSLVRDIDVIACPWTHDAVPAWVLADALRITAHTVAGDAFIHPVETGLYHTLGSPGHKPQGRLVWSFYLPGGPYIDLSVMPTSDYDHEKAFQDCIAFNRMREMMKIVPGKRGRLPTKQDPRTLMASRYIRPSLMPPSREIHYGSLLRQYDMLANDVAGDCVPAAALHAVQDFTANANRATFLPSRAMALSAYHDVAGYIEGQADTDKGVEPLTFMNYWRDHGIGALASSNGQVILPHKIGGYLQIDPTNLTEMQLAIELFGGVMFAGDFPDAIDTTDKWFLDQCDGAPAEGHETWINGFDTNGDYDHVTWGRYFPSGLSKSFAAKFGECPIAVFTDDWLNDKTLQSPPGFDAKGLQRDLLALQNLAA